MASPYIAIAVALIAAAFLLVPALVKNVILSPLRSIPGPWHAGFTDLALKLSVITGNRIHYVHRLHQRYGPVVRISPNEVAVNDVESFKEIHRIGSGFNKSIWYQQLNLAERPGVFSMTDPRQHAARRKLFARAFSKTFLRQNWEWLVQEKSRLAVSRIKEELHANDKTSDVMKWWMFLATDVATHLMFGESFRTLESGEKSTYNRILESALMGGGIASELPLVRPLLQALPFRRCRELFNADDYLKDYAIVAVRNSKNMGSKSNIFHTIISEAENGDSDELTDLDVRLEAGNLIVAGSDTTGVTLTYLTWAVLQRPALRAAIEEEVASLQGELADANLEKLPLLNATIEETLRLYGAAPGGLPRIVPSGGATLKGYYLPAGATVTTQGWSLHRDPDNFHEPERFDPGRWLLDGAEKLSERGKSAYSPFGAGARVCLGVHLARMELRIAAALFFQELREAKLAPSAMGNCMDVVNYFLIAPKGHMCEITLPQN